MGYEEIESRIEELLNQCKENDDYSPVDDFIDENGDEFDDLDEMIFRKAVSLSCKEYVEDHADDFELNDTDEGHSSYLYETDDDEIREILCDHGACRNWEDFCDEDYLFAYETANGYILALDDHFQKEVYQAYLDRHGLSEQDIIDFFEDADDYEAPEDDDYDLEEDLTALGVTMEEGKITFFFPDHEWDGRAFCEVMERLGWSTEFEGDSWQLETIGVYYIKRK